MDIETVRARASAALQNLEANRARINGLNVYPVPDGDTGTNLTLTLRAIVAALDASTATGPDAVAHELSRAALMGARGNSGVILSQIVRGAASVLGEQDGTDAPLIARALRAASDEAYRATLRPVEGTMLTVIREMAEEAERRSSAGRLSREELLAAVVAHGEDTLRRTPEMLPKLKEAGVVDAGGAGLVEIMRGVHLSAAGLPLPEVSEDEEAKAPPLDHEFSEFAFCTNFVIEGDALDRDAVAESLGVLGDSLHVVGDSSLLRVHVHTDDPDAAVAVAERHGTVVQSTFDAADMHEQVREQLLLSGNLVTAVVAVAAGEGNRRTFERVFGEVRVVSGGASANPSVQELADAVNETLAREVVLLPNDGNVLKAAIQATEFATKPVRVVPSRSVQAGIHLVNGPYRHEMSADVNVDDMTRDLECVLAGEVTRASRTVVQDGVGVTEGDWLDSWTSGSSRRDRASTRSPSPWPRRCSARETGRTRSISSWVRARPSSTPSVRSSQPPPPRRPGCRSSRVTVANRTILCSSSPRAEPSRTAPGRSRPRPRCLHLRRRRAARSPRRGRSGQRRRPHRRPRRSWRLPRRRTGCSACCSSRTARCSARRSGRRRTDATGSPSSVCGRTASRRSARSRSSHPTWSPSTSGCRA